MTTERDIRNFITEAKAEGRQAGLAEGEAKGRKAGLAEGRQEASIEFAKKLLANGVDLPTVVSYTGLSEEQVKAL